MARPITTSVMIARQIGVVVFVMFIVGVLAYAYQEELRGLLRRLPSGERVLIETFVDTRVARPLDGVLVDEMATSTVFGVILDNAPEAWPQYGLSRAQMVWEFPVEGGRTRLLALYDGSALSGDAQIGPVRSVRPYFLDIARAYGAYVVHVGGSPAALNMIAQGTVKSLNEFSAGSYFWRDAARYAPHNVMTNGAELLDAASDRSISVSLFEGWRYGDVSSDEHVSPSWKFGELSVSWQFENGAYARYVGGEPVYDAEGEAIRAANVVVVYAPMRVVDEALRREIVTVGEGKMVAFVAGVRVEGVWARDDEEQVMRMYDEDGNEIEFARGATWVEVLPSTWSIQTSTSG